MRRHLQLRNSFETQRFDERSWAVELAIVNSEVSSIICELTLLLYGRSDQLSLLFESKKKIVVSVAQSESAIIGSDDRFSSLSLNRNDAEFLLCFLLTWYRDGVAEVNHIDIELIGSQSDGKDCTLVVKAENSQAPLPGDEAERILRELK